MPETVTHPSVQALALFSSGKLSEAQAVTVATHLETCADCRGAVEKLPPDSFLGKVRAAKPGGTVLPAPTGLPSGASVAGASGPAVPVPDLPPELVDHPKFRVVRELGRGGMGVIYLAEHRVMDKPVALKVISASVLDNPTAVARFLSEVRAAGKLDHPNIARAYDADRAGELHFLVMEFVEGVSLAQVLEKRGPLPVAHACHYVRQAALGLQHAFEKGMVHRDIKPQNLMLTPKGVVKVLDFGLARVRDERKKVAPRLTRLESFMGTPTYVAPEQAVDAREADTRADIYSLGCTLYALLAGRPPFVGDSLTEILLAHIEKEARPLHELRPDVPVELSAVVAKMLAKDPAQRFQRPVEAAQALAPFIKKAKGPEHRDQAPAAPAIAPEPFAFTTDVARLSPKLFDGSEREEDPFAFTTDVARAPRRRGRGRRLFVIATAVLFILALVLLILWAGGVLRVKTKDGTIVLENLPPDAEVTVDGDRATLKTLDGKTFEVSVAPGKKHQLQVRKDGFKVFGKEVEIDAGAQKPIQVHLEPAVAAAGGQAADAGFVSLFNGKDLKGWKMHPDEAHGWSAEAGCLRGRGPGATTLFSERDDFANVHVSMKVRTTGPGTCFLGFRYAYRVFGAYWPVRPLGYTAFLTTPAPWGPVSTFLGFHAGIRERTPPQTTSVNANEWMRFEVIAQGPRLRILVNGTERVDYKDPDNLFERGHLALIVQDGAGMDVSEISVKELK
jgi:serine/threonine protein kinase